MHAVTAAKSNMQPSQQKQHKQTTLISIHISMSTRNNSRKKQKTTDATVAAADGGDATVAADGGGDANAAQSTYSIEPDVVIVVGQGNDQKEFYEYGQVLCCVSEFFKAALRSGMQETTSKKFEFPDIKVDDWQLLSNVIQPCPKSKIGKGNVNQLLPLIDQLGISSLLDVCDNIYETKIIVNKKYDPFNGNLVSIFGKKEPPKPWYIQTEKQQIKNMLPQLLDIANTCIQYNLPKAQIKSIQLIHNYFKYLPDIFDTTESIKGLISILKQSNCCDVRETMWKSIIQVLPEEFKKKEMEYLLQSEVLPYLIQLYVKEKVQQIEMETLKHTMKSGIQEKLPQRMNSSISSNSKIKLEKVLRDVAFWNSVMSHHNISNMDDDSSIESNRSNSSGSSSSSRSSFMFS